MGSKRLKARAETSCVTAAGRFLPRAALVGTTWAAKVGLEKWREHLCHAIPHGHSQNVEAWQPRQFVHQMDLATLKQSADGNDDDDDDNDDDHGDNDNDDTNDDNDDDDNDDNHDNNNDDQDDDNDEAQDCSFI